MTGPVDKGIVGTNLVACGRNHMLTIECATEADLPAILDLYLQAGIDDDAHLPLEQAKVIFARMRSYPNYHLYVARNESGAVGTFALLIMDNLGHLGACTGVVEDVAVHPAMQGQGVGKAMMEFAKEQCRKSGCYKLTLSSNLKRHSAHTFYQSLGFEQHGYSFVIDPGS